MIEFYIFVSTFCFKSAGEPQHCIEVARPSIVFDMRQDETRRYICDYLGKHTYGIIDSNITMTSYPVQYPSPTKQCLFCPKRLRLIKEEKWEDVE